MPTGQAKFRGQDDNTTIEQACVVAHQGIAPDAARPPAQQAHTQPATPGSPHPARVGGEKKCGLGVKWSQIEPLSCQSKLVHANPS